VVAAASLLLACGVAAGAAWATRTVLPRDGEVARGVQLDGRSLGGVAEPEAIAARAAATRLDRPLRLVDAGGRVLLVATARDLGATFDSGSAIRAARSVGRRGDLAQRIAESWRARTEGVTIRPTLHVPALELARRLEEAKEETDARARAARLDVDTGRVTPHVDGRWLDAFATAERVERAVLGDASAIEVVVRANAPAASSSAVSALDARVELARFDTRFGGPVGRDRNIQRAATALDGVVLMPGEEVSFNAEVGPRSADNGFFAAPEIYRGESREGIGGGVCQVASTVYAAALFAGLDVTERRNHSRPSAYIRPGLDATVSYPVLDLRMQNRFPFPVVLDTRIEGGVLHARVMGAGRPVEVQLATETAGISKFKRKVERAGWLREGGSKLKQRGKNGMSIRRTLRTRAEGGGAELVVTTMDVYPATQEIWLLAPGADAEAVLPPFDAPVDADAAPTAAAPGPA